MFKNPIAGKDRYDAKPIRRLVCGHGSESRVRVFGSVVKTVPHVSKELLMVREQQLRLPIWGIFMKKCYADKDAYHFHQSDFDRPKNLSIKVDCWVPVKDTTDTEFEQDTDEFEL